MGSYLDWIGYIASLIVLISLIMSSVKRLRWINLIGSLVFGVYGFLIQSIPTGLMNVGIVLINVYYLTQMYRQKDYFQLLETTENDAYYQNFNQFYGDEIKRYMEINEDLMSEGKLRLFVLRNLVPAGLLIGTVKGDELLIDVDYVTPMYRDFKIAKFLFQDQKSFFLGKGIRKLSSLPGNDKHERYLIRMGFTRSNDQEGKTYIKELS